MGKQTDSFRELGAFLEHKTGTAQVWNNRYKQTLTTYLDRYGVDVLIGACLRADFDKVEYAVEIWTSLDERTEEQEWWIPAARERYHDWRKGRLNERVGKMDELVDQLVGAVTTRKPKPKWDAGVEYVKLWVKHGGHSPEAREFARKWGL